MTVYFAKNKENYQSYVNGAKLFVAVAAFVATLAGAFANVRNNMASMFAPRVNYAFA